MRNAMHSLLALFLVVLVTGVAAPAAHAQYGNEIELRGVRSRVFEPVLANLAFPGFQSYAVASIEAQFGDGLVTREAAVGLTDALGTPRTATIESELVDGPDGIQVTGAVRGERLNVDIDLVLPVDAGAIVDVFVGRSSRTTFTVTADGQVVSQVRLSRQDLDRDGWADGVLEEIIDAKTGAVNEVFFHF